MYILDTSALKGIGRAKLEAAKTTHDLAISPLTFYELLCHLDEIDEEMTFARQKGLVMKCQLPRILHDPFAYHAIAVGATHVANTSRFEDPTIIAQLLAQLGNAESLEAFYETTVTYPDGQIGRCRDVSDRVRQVLEDEEQKYVEHLDAIKQELETSFPDCASAGITPQQMADYIAASLKTMVASYKNEDGITDECLATKVTSSMYMHLGYKASRTAHYMKAAHNSGSTFTPDPNDCEDSYITMCLELFKRDVLVTGDTGTLSALRDTKEAFRLFFKDQDQLQIESRVLSKEEFLDEVTEIQQ